MELVEGITAIIVVETINVIGGKKCLIKEDGNIECPDILII